MRLPRLLPILIYAVSTGLCLAGDGPRTDVNPAETAARRQSPKTPDSAALLPEMFIPPHAWQQAQKPGSGQAPDTADNLCYNIHSVVVAEDDHTGVTHQVRESTCTRATRFQMKNADAASK